MQPMPNTFTVLDGRVSGCQVERMRFRYIVEGAETRQWSSDE